jgi:hypothetical protein
MPYILIYVDMETKFEHRKLSKEDKSKVNAAGARVIKRKMKELR